MPLPEPADRWGRRYSADVKLALLLVGCVLAIGGAPLAHADDDDTAYEAAIRSVGVPANSPATATAYGRALCDRISEVGFDPLVGVVHHEISSAGITMRQSALVIGVPYRITASTKSFRCPKPHLLGNCG
jgi:hypothetical protein